MCLYFKTYILGLKNEKLKEIFIKNIRHNVSDI